LGEFEIGSCFFRGVRAQQTGVEQYLRIGGVGKPPYRLVLPSAKVDGTFES
jgi:hypothetical protein